MGKNKKNKNRAGKAGIGWIGVFLLIAISVYTVRLYQKDQIYIEREQELEMLYQQETEREEKLSEYQEYIESREYLEDTARSKLGLFYNNEIIFREK